MSRAKLYVNKQDRWRLSQAVQSARRSWGTYGPYLDWLATQLEDAHAYEPAEVPADVVTMNSQIELEDLRTGEKRTFKLVYPNEPDRASADDRAAVSVFEPTGLAVLGGRVGDVVGWSEPEGSRTARVRRLAYQPEAAGDLHL